MNNYIENLKQKPEHVKKRFAFIVSFSFAFIIFAGWIVSYGINSSPVITDNNSNDGTTVDAPVSSLTATVVGAYDDIKNMIFGSNKVQYSSDIIEVSGGKR